MILLRLGCLLSLSVLLAGWPCSGAGEGAIAPDEDRPQGRDPFWPVGYVPKKVVKPLVVPTTSEKTKAMIPDSARLPLWDEARKALDIRGISMIGHDKGTGQPRYLAMITGRLIEAGDTVSASFENRVYRWKVVEIDKTGVMLQKLDVRADETR
jgi:hypothetical protein